MVPGYPDTQPITSLPGSSLSVRIHEISKLIYQYDVYIEINGKQIVNTSCGQTHNGDL